jgi:hypothetical protein
MDNRREDIVSIKADLAILKAKVRWMENKIKIISLKFFVYSVRRNLIKKCLRYWPWLLVFALVFFAFGVVHDEGVFLKLASKVAGV